MLQTPILISTSSIMMLINSGRLASAKRINTKLLNKNKFFKNKRQFRRNKLSEINKYTEMNFTQIEKEVPVIMIDECSPVKVISSSPSKSVKSNSGNNLLKVKKKRMSKKREESKISILKINDDLDNTSQLSDSYTTFKSNSSINLSEIQAKPVQPTPMNEKKKKFLFEK